RPSTNNYGDLKVISDLAVQSAAYLDTLRWGGNTNEVNTYSSVSLSDLTGEVLNAEDLFDTTNPRGGWFYAQLAQSFTSDAASTSLDVLPAAFCYRAGQ
ncbi:hypothetical protein DOTSEDRAFT_133275, partial [Dothistroma septosporum NZE10]